jgi:hypothetical protein
MTEGTANGSAIIHAPAAMLRRIYKKELARLEQYATQLPLAKTGDAT